MKITVDIPDSEVEEICFFTGEKKKGPAVRKLVADALMLRRRRDMADKFVSGEWGVSLETFEDSESREKSGAREGEQAWRT